MFRDTGISKLVSDLTVLSAGGLLGSINKQQPLKWRQRGGGCTFLTQRFNQVPGTQEKVLSQHTQHS